MKIQIDKWDTWSMDHTLAHIILPMLKQLKATQHGSPFVDDEDLPEHLRMTDYRDDYSGQKDLFDHIGVCPVSEVPSLTEMRWDWVLDEMINVFEKYVDHSWEDKYRSGEHDIQWVKLENGMSQMQHGPNDTYKCDYEGMQKEQDRINNGLRLFGKYYRGLWD
jgi:hypothetical protein